MLRRRAHQCLSVGRIRATLWVMRERSMQRQYPWRVVFMIGVALTLTLPVNTIAHERAVTSLQATPGPTGEHVDIGGRSLFLSCTGTGAPTVVLEAGSGNS